MIGDSMNVYLAQAMPEEIYIQNFVQIVPVRMGFGGCTRNITRSHT